MPDRHLLYLLYLLGDGYDGGALGLNRDGGGLRLIPGIGRPAIVQLRSRGSLLMLLSLPGIACAVVIVMHLLVVVSLQGVVLHLLLLLSLPGIPSVVIILRVRLISPWLLLEMMIVDHVRIVFGPLHSVGARHFDDFKMVTDKITWCCDNSKTNDWMIGDDLNQWCRDE